MQSESHQWIRQVSQELLQQSSELNGIVVRKIYGSRIPIQRFGNGVESLDISILPEDTFDRHVCKASPFDQLRSCRHQTSAGLPICFMAEMMLSMNSGTRSWVLVAPSWESLPVFSTKISRGTPKTPMEG
jgi:hypothetical protein